MVVFWSRSRRATSILRPLQLRSQEITKNTSQLQSYLLPLSAVDRTHTHTKAATRETRERERESKRERAQTSSRIHRYAQPDPH